MAMEGGRGQWGKRGPHLSELPSAIGPNEKHSPVHPPSTLPRMSHLAARPPSAPCSSTQDASPVVTDGVGITPAGAFRPLEWPLAS